jgi:hypothetical protein
MSLAALLKKPSAFLPLLMSLAAIALLVAVAATTGLVRQPDEGTAAHLWQLLIGLQLPIVAVFVARWLPRGPRAGALVVGLQIAAAVAAAWPVFALKL